MMFQKMTWIAVLAGLSLVVSAQASGSLKGTVAIKKKVKTKGPTSQKDLVLYLEAVGAKSKSSKAIAKMDQVKMNFEPHVLVVQKGTKVEFANGDAVLHNVFSPDMCCKMDLGQWGKGEKKSYTFSKEGVGVLLCNLHPEMEAYVVVVGSPYFTQTNIDKKTKSASYSIRNIPAGKYLLKTWNKKLKQVVKEVTIEEGKETILDFVLKK